MTHTYVELEISQPAYDEIKEKLASAGYDHAIGLRLDLHGIALAKQGASKSDSWEGKEIKEIEGWPGEDPPLPFRVGRRVPRNVYWGNEPVFMAATEKLARELVELLNKGQEAK